MRRNQRLLLSLGCVVSLAGACDDGGTTPAPAPITGTAGSAAGTTGATAGSAAAGTGAPRAGTTGAAGAAGAAGSGLSTGGTSGAAGTSAPALQGFATCGKPAKDGACKSKAPGIYALKTEVDVWFRDEFNSPPVFDAGRGKITIYFRGTLSDVCEDGSGGKAIMQACGTRLPGLYADANGGVIQIVFPDELWDKPGMPTYTTTGSTSGFAAGDTLTINKTAGLLGIELPGAANEAKFPTYEETATFACASGTGGQCFPDQDGDGNPGVTVNIQLTGTPPSPGYENPLFPWKYIPAPVDIGGAALGDGAKDVYIGLRTSIGGSGLIGMDCNSGVGAADADDFVSRAFACVMADGSKCAESGGDTSGIGFLDKNTPTFHVLKAGETPPAEWKHTRAEVDTLLDRTPSVGPKSAVVRLGELGSSSTCADVRNAEFPAFN